MKFKYGKPLPDKAKFFHKINSKAMLLKVKRRHLQEVTGVDNSEWTDEAVEIEYYNYFMHNDDHVECYEE